MLAFNTDRSMTINGIYAYRIYNARYFQCNPPLHICPSATDNKNKQKNIIQAQKGSIQFISKHKIICYRKDRIVAFYEKSNQTHMAKMFTSV